MRKYVLLGLLAIAALLYAPSLNNGFVEWDDGLLITENWIVQETSFRSIKAAFTTFDPELYVPLTLLSYQVDHLIAGLEPFVFHAHNLLYHLLNILLLFWITIMLTKKRWVALLTAALFALHPIHAEAVVWASSRKDLQSALFFLLSLGLYLRYQSTNQTKWYGLSIVSFLLGLLSKVSIVTLPLVLIITDVWNKRPITKQSLYEKIPYFLLSSIFGIVALFGKHGSEENLFEKLLIGCKAALFYIYKLIIPSNFSVLYPYTKDITLMQFDLLIPLIVVVIISLSAFLLYKKHEAVSLLWIFYLLMLIPTFSNFAKGRDIPRDIYFASDRYVYISSIAIILGVALILYALRSRFRLIVDSSVVVILIVLSVQTYTQSLVWKDTETLFTYVLDKYPNSHVAHNNIGSIAYKNGDVLSAIASYKTSLNIRTNYQAYYNLGQLYRKAGDTVNAKDMYAKAIKSNAHDAAAHLNLGVIYLNARDFEEALASFLRAAQIDPSLSIVHYNLGLVYEYMGQIDKALESYKEVLKIDPDDAEVKQKVQQLTK